MKIRVIACVGVVLVISGCSSLPSQPYNKAGNKVTSIAVAPVGMPDKPAVRILGSVGSNFGLVGALVEESRAAAATKELQDIFATTHYDYRTDFTDQLLLAMQVDGLAVSPVSGQRQSDAQMKFLKQCPAPSGTDACLDVYVDYIGYMAAGATTEYVPTVHLTAKMTRATGSELLFQDSIHYNPMQYSKGIVVQPSREYRFKDRDAMKADPERVTKGLQEAVHAATAELAKQFN